MSEQGKLTVVSGFALMLGSLPLMAVYSNFIAWIIPAGLAIACVSLCGALARRFSRGILIQALAMLTALLMLMTVFFRSGEEYLGIFPSLGTLQHFADLVTRASVDVNTLIVPVTVNTQLLFVTVLSIGLLAVVNDLFIVGLRTPAFSGICFLTMYMVPVSINPESTAWLWFATSAAAYLWVLAADHQANVLRFGLRFTGSGHMVAKNSPSPLAGPGTILVASLLAVTIMTAGFLPTTSDGFLDRFGTGGTGGDSSESQGRVDPWVQLRGELDRPDPVDLAYIETDNDQPPYLRLHVADRLDETGFRPSSPQVSGQAVQRANYAGQFPLQLEPEGEYKATVTNMGLTDSAVPYYGQLTGMDISTSWSYYSDSATVRSQTETLSEVDEYSFTYQSYDYEADRLREAPDSVSSDFAAANSLDTPHVPELSTIVSDLVGDIDNQYDAVSEIHEFFSPDNGFSYDLMTAQGGSSTAILDFLEYRQGYCEQYAAAMAWMVREAGYASRVAIGLTRGTRDGDGWVVNSHNWHAWVEVYFDGFGWVPFDPTPSSGVQNSVAFPWSAPSIDDDGEESDSETDNETQTEDSETPQDSPDFDLPDAHLPDAGGGSSAHTQSDAGISTWWIVLAVAVVLFFVPATARILTRRSRLRPSTVGGESAWSETLDMLTDFRRPVAASRTPRQTAAEVAGFAPDGAWAIHELSSAVETSRYGLQDVPAGHLPAAVSALRGQVKNHVRPRSRLGAWLWPRSTWLHTRSWLQRVRLTIGNGVEAAGARMPWRRSQTR
ncbi:transglutaminase TgpA family protein [Natronoglycomyces albus]|uniref:Transglutaminase domain-containing protein n=1 Tax=Natronoglycomyces albus TaxID=2811108 RepID=A0A895XLK3_9ACTN|nr:DUF3488 and transglutaminase-like domain-containing protein [Natronoglycomyces albus]QSB06581.1 transglutaminase domain-containing protein [Natronoglycomyces albus]